MIEDLVMKKNIVKFLRLFDKNTSCNSQYELI